MKRLLCFLLLLQLNSLTHAQEQICPDMQKEALTNIANHCAEQEPGTVCLGNPTVSLVATQSSTANFRFSQPGDVAPLGSIDWFSTSSEARTWGAAKVVFQAYPAGGLVEETVVMLLFGDTVLFIPPVGALPTSLHDVEVLAAQGANLRAEPNTESRVIKPAVQRTRLKAVRRSEDGEWIQVYIDPLRLGWVNQSVITGNVSTLRAAEPPHAGAPLWFPLQSFDFRTGIDDALCEDSHDSGILLQAPKYAPPRRFVINGLTILLNGTAFLQAQNSAGTWVYQLDGEARITGADATVVVKSGFFTHFPLKNAEEDSPVPAKPSAYDYHDMALLPIHALLYPTRVGLDAYAVVRRRPGHGNSPLFGMSLEAPCKISAGTFGANIRSRPDPDAPIIAVMGYRESADPVARAIGADDLPWWKLDEHVWIRIDATVTGGNCNAIPLVRYEI